MTLSSFDKENVRLLPLKHVMKERKELTLYIVSNTALVLRNGSDPSGGVELVIVLKRMIMNELMTTYMPSTLLILITFATTLFKPFFFEAALSVNLTTMLVMTTIFIGQMQMLPSTAYVKMVDVWLIFCQLIPFAEVILLTLMELNRDGDGSGTLEDTTVMDFIKDQNGIEDKLEDKTQTINHHGAPRVVHLNMYRDEKLDDEDKELSPEEEAGMKKKNHLRVLKFLGLYFSQ